MRHSNGSDGSGTRSSECGGPWKRPPGGLTQTPTPCAGWQYSWAASNQTTRIPRPSQRRPCPNRIREGGVAPPAAELVRPLESLLPWRAPPGVAGPLCRQGPPPGGHAQQLQPAQHLLVAGKASPPASASGRRHQRDTRRLGPLTGNWPHRPRPRAPHHQRRFGPSSRRPPLRGNQSCRHRPTHLRRFRSLRRPRRRWDWPALPPARRGPRPRHRQGPAAPSRPDSKSPSLRR